MKRHLRGRGLSAYPMDGTQTKGKDKRQTQEKKIRCKINGELDGAEFCGKGQSAESGQEEGLGCAMRSGRPH